MQTRPIQTFCTPEVGTHISVIKQNLADYCLGRSLQMMFSMPIQFPEWVSKVGILAEILFAWFAWFGSGLDTFAPRWSRSDKGWPATEVDISIERMDFTYVTGISALITQKKHSGFHLWYLSHWLSITVYIVSHTLAITSLGFPEGILFIYLHICIRNIGPNKPHIVCVSGVYTAHCLNIFGIDFAYQVLFFNESAYSLRVVSLNCIFWHKIFINFLKFAWNLHIYGIKSASFIQQRLSSLMRSLLRGRGPRTRAAQALGPLAGLCSEPIGPEEPAADRCRLRTAACHGRDPRLPLQTGRAIELVFNVTSDRVLHRRRLRFVSVIVVHHMSFPPHLPCS